MTLLDVHVAEGEDADRGAALAGAVEDASEHPIARAITVGATMRVGELPRRGELRELRGVGRAGTRGGDGALAVLVGRPRLFPERSQPLLRGPRRHSRRRGGRTAVAVGWDGAARGSGRGRRRQDDLGGGGRRCARSG